MTGHPMRIATAALFAALVSLAGAPAFAAGGDSGGSDPKPVECRKGWTYSEAKKECVRNQSLNDDELYRQGRALALAGHYESALDALTAVRATDDAMVLTMIGYATRKLGRLEEGIAIYHQALAIDPQNVNTHEYLGEGYLDAGRIDLAEAQLDTLKGLCGTDCSQYQDLARAIAGDSRWN